MGTVVPYSTVDIDLVYDTCSNAEVGLDSKRTSWGWGIMYHVGLRSGFSSPHL